MHWFLIKYIRSLCVCVCVLKLNYVVLHYSRFVATVECNSPHEGRQLVHTILPINIETLFNLLFSKSKFLLDFHKMRNSSDLKFGEWSVDDSGLKVRKVNVTVQLSASVGPKTAKVRAKTHLHRHLL